MVEKFEFPYSEIDPDLLSACIDFSKDLGFTFQIDFTKFLLALSGVESSFGKNLAPRVEKAYLPGGKYYIASPKLQDEYKKWGEYASASHGPWQVLHIIAVEYGYKWRPEDLVHPRVSGPFVVKHLNKFAHNGANSVERVLDCYNTGNFIDKNIPYAYIEKWWKMYVNLIDDRSVS